MHFITTNSWNESLWKRARVVYEQAFGTTGVKSDSVIRNMFHKQICVLHVILDGSKVIAMALTGELRGKRDVLIDYLAVDVNYRHRQIGKRFVKYLKEWCISKKAERIIIEVESIETAINEQRILFWKKCGFQLTKYVHHYRWVPETYQAMSMWLLPNKMYTENGEELFTYIQTFHRLCYQNHTSRLV